MGPFTSILVIVLISALVSSLVCRVLDYIGDVEARLSKLEDDARYAERRYKARP